MLKLKIAIDCDDVLIDTTEFLVTEYNRIYNTKVKLEQAFEKNNPDWQIDRSELQARFLNIQSSANFAKLAPRSDAVEVINRLGIDHELHLVTARDSAVELVTLQMLDKYFANCFHQLHHLGRKVSKGGVCRQIGADVLVDDNLKHLEDAKENGVKYNFWFGDYLWQKQDKLAKPKADQCSSWYDVEKRILEISNVDNKQA